MIKIYCYTDVILDFYINSFVGYDFFGIDLHRAEFKNHNLDNASFKDVQMRNIIIIKSSAVATNFSYGSMMCAFIEESNLTKANFYRARLMASNIVGSDLSFSNFKESMVNSCDFSRTNLRGADLRFLSYDKATFTDCIYDERTIWPTDFDPIEHGAILVKAK